MGTSVILFMPIQVDQNEWYVRWQNTWWRLIVLSILFSSIGDESLWLHPVQWDSHTLIILVWYMHDQTLTRACTVIYSVRWISPKMLVCWFHSWSPLSILEWYFGITDMSIIIIKAVNAFSVNIAMHGNEIKAWMLFVQGTQHHDNFHHQILL